MTIQKFVFADMSLTDILIDWLHNSASAEEVAKISADAFGGVWRAFQDAGGYPLYELLTDEDYWGAFDEMTPEAEYNTIEEYYAQFSPHTSPDNSAEVSSGVSPEISAEE